MRRGEGVGVFSLYSPPLLACVFVCACHRFSSMTYAMHNPATAELFVEGLVAVLGKADLLRAFLAPTISLCFLT